MDWESLRTCHELGLNVGHLLIGKMVFPNLRKAQIRLIFNSVKLKGALKHGFQEGRSKFSQTRVQQNIDC